MMIRKYKSEDCEYLSKLFYDTVHFINARDYTEEQLNAWATGSVDLEAWDKSFLSHFTVVAVEDNRIIGFGDIASDGYLNRLYVHKDYQGRGAAGTICNKLEQAVGHGTITTYASITAKSFFEKRGYKVVREQSTERDRVFLTNYLMNRPSGI